MSSEGTDLPQDNTTTYYSFSNHGSGKWLNLKGSDCWRDPFILLPWLLGGRVPTLPKSEIPNLEAIIFSCQPFSIRCIYQSNYATQGRIELRNNWWIKICEPKMCVGSLGGFGLHELSVITYDHIIATSALIPSILANFYLVPSFNKHDWR